MTQAESAVAILLVSGNRLLSTLIQGQAADATRTVDSSGDCGGLPSAVVRALMNCDEAATKLRSHGNCFVSGEKSLFSI